MRSAGTATRSRRPQLSHPQRLTHPSDLVGQCLDRLHRHIPRTLRRDALEPRRSVAEPTRDEPDVVGLHLGGGPEYLVEPGHIPVTKNGHNALTSQTRQVASTLPQGWHQALRFDPAPAARI